MKSALTIGVLLTLAAATSAQHSTLRHFDEVVPLVRDAGRVALLRADFLPSDDDARAALERLGLGAATRHAHGIAGMTLVDVPTGMASDDLVTRLAADAGGLFAAPVFLDHFGMPLVPTPKILLRFEADVDVAAQRALLDGLTATTGAEIADGPRWANLDDAWAIALPSRDGRDVLQLANALADRDDVRFAVPNCIFGGRSQLVPSDPLFGDSWALHNVGQSGGTPDEDMDAVEAFDVTTGNSDVLVVVIDVGVEQDHPDIAQVPGADFVFEASGGDAFNACDHHGTAVAGCISAILDNGLGTCGVAPGTRVASARSFSSTLSCDGSWSSFFESTPNALAWAQGIGARVTNNSNFYGFTDPATEDAYADTRAAGIVHVASAGNFSVSFVEYPASLPDVLAVSATNRFGGLASFSSWGTGLALSAPGLDILTTDRTGADGYDAGDFATVSGTSFSSPYCAGVAALVVSRNSSLSAYEVEDILFASAVDHGAAGYDTVFGYGVVNAHAALFATPAFITSGLGLAGTAGVPSLVGIGNLYAGTLNEINLSNAKPNALAAIFLAASSQPVGFKGGMLYPGPFLPPALVATSPTGAIDLAFMMPAGVPSGELWVQWAVADQAALYGVALSNAIVGDTP